jgi:hypothetical protein
MPEIRTIHHVSHESGGGDEIDLTGLTGRVNFVSRGDIASADFTQATLNLNANWHDLNISSIVPAAAKAVLVRLYIYATEVNKLLGIRPKGFALGGHYSGLRSQVANTEAESSMVMDLGTGGLLEYYGTDTTLYYAYITILGWFI